MQQHQDGEGGKRRSGTCLEVSGRRMPPALFLGCSTFSTSTRLNDGIRRFIAAIASHPLSRLLFFFLANKQSENFYTLRFRPPLGVGFRVLRGDPNRGGEEMTVLPLPALETSD